MIIQYKIYCIIIKVVFIVFVRRFHLMTRIQKIDNNSRPFLTPKNTGYAAAGAMLLTCIRKKPLAKYHKPLGWITAGLTALHIGLIEYYHHKYKKM